MNEKPHLLSDLGEIQYMVSTYMQRCWVMASFVKIGAEKAVLFKVRCLGKVCTTPRITPSAVFQKCGPNHCTKSYKVQFLTHTQNKLCFQRISAVSRNDLFWESQGTHSYRVREICGVLNVTTRGCQPRQDRNIHTGSSAHPAYYSWGSGGSFPGAERQGFKSNHSPPSNAQVKNQWSYTSAPPVCLHGV